MSEILTHNEAKRLAGLELNALVYHGVLPHDTYDVSSLEKKATPFYDCENQLLFYRFAIYKENHNCASIDIAVNNMFMHHLLTIDEYNDWDPAALLREARHVYLSEHNGSPDDEAKFICYSYPMLAIQFLRDNKEVVLLTLHTWIKIDANDPVRSQQYRELINLKGLQSFFDDNHTRIKGALDKWDDIINIDKQGYDIHAIDNKAFSEMLTRLPIEGGGDSEPAIDRILPPDSKGHAIKRFDIEGYKLFGQINGYWCVPASVEMILNYYHYELTQPEIARLLGISDTTGLDGDNSERVVKVIEEVSKHMVCVKEYDSPKFEKFQDYVDAFKMAGPMISFIPGHSRTITGYIDVINAKLPAVSDILIVYDPWPVGKGAVSYQPFGSHYYYKTFTTKLIKKD